MKIDKEKIIYLSLRVLGWCARIMPFWLLYACSDIGYFFVYKVFKYRLAITKKNLRNSFPQTEEKELKRIERRFYHHLCDYGVEVLKLYSLSKRTAQKRMKIKNPEEMEHFFRAGRPVFVLMGHCANWEYFTTVPLWYRHLPQVEFAHVYRPLHSEGVDRFIYEMREHAGSKNISEHQLIRWLFTMKQEHKVYLFGALAEQIPRQDASIQWVTFLHQDTPFFNGVERIAAQLGAVIGFFDIQRVRRGYYEATFKVISEYFTKKDVRDVTNQYARELEQSILQSPPYWLWTHNRWKRGREDYRIEEHI